MYYVYVVRCADKTLYTGIAVDVPRRVHEHNNSPRGARYTKARRPVRLIYSRRYRNRSTASRAEHKFKSLSRVQKLLFIKS